MSSPCRVERVCWEILRAPSMLLCVSLTPSSCSLRVCQVATRAAMLGVLLSAACAARSSRRHSELAPGSLRVLARPILRRATPAQPIGDRPVPSERRASMRSTSSSGARYDALSDLPPARAPSTASRDSAPTFATTARSRRGAEPGTRTRTRTRGRRRTTRSCRRDSSRCATRGQACALARSGDARKARRRPRASTGASAHEPTSPRRSRGNRAAGGREACFAWLSQLGPR